MALRKNNCGFHSMPLKWGQIVHPFFNSSQCYYTSNLPKFILQRSTTTYCVRVHRNKPCREVAELAADVCEISSFSSAGRIYPARDIVAFKYGYGQLKQCCVWKIKWFKMSPLGAELFHEQSWTKLICCTLYWNIWTNKFVKHCSHVKINVQAYMVMNEWAKCHGQMFLKYWPWLLLTSFYFPPSG